MIKISMLDSSEKKFPFNLPNHFFPQYKEEKISQWQEEGNRILKRQKKNDTEKVKVQRPDSQFTIQSIISNFLLQQNSKSIPFYQKSIEL